MKNGNKSYCGRLFSKIKQNKLCKSKIIHLLEFRHGNACQAVKKRSIEGLKGGGGGMWLGREGLESEESRGIILTFFCKKFILFRIGEN